MAGIEVTRAPEAPMAGGDPTRGFAVRARGRVLMPGLTRPEAEHACEWIAAIAEDDLSLVLAEVALPVVLTDGVGPHLLDSGGRLVLALAPHPTLAGMSIAMGDAASGHSVGLVRRLGAGGWAWAARAECGEPDRVDMLDQLDGAGDWAGVREWATRWAGVVPTLAE